MTATSQPCPPVTCLDMDRMLAFLPLFDVAGRTFAVAGPDGRPDITTLHTLPYTAYEDYVRAFQKELARPSWQVPIRDPQGTANMMFCTCHIHRADLDQVLDMLRWIARFDRQERGALIQSLVEDGRLTSILKRLAELRGRLS